MIVYVFRRYSVDVFKINSNLFEMKLTKIDVSVVTICITFIKKSLQIYQKLPHHALQDIPQLILARENLRLKLVPLS